MLAPRKAGLSIGALAGAIMVFEIVLLRVFSFSIWHHFAFMVISIALLGFAVSGVLLELRPSLGAPPARRAAQWGLGFALTSMFAVTIVTRIPFDHTQIGENPWVLGYLFLYYLVLMVPFTFAGLAIVTLLSGWPGSEGRLYAADLLGAGLGCFVVVALLGPIDGEGVVLLSGAIAASASWLLATIPDDAPTPRRPWIYGVAAVLLLVSVPLASTLAPIPPGSSKGLGLLFEEDGEETQSLLTRWDPLYRVDVVETKRNTAWTAHSKWPKTLKAPRERWIYLDGHALTPSLEWSGELGEFEFMDWTLSSAAAQAFHPKRALIIGAGGGVDVLTALHHGTEHVDTVELSPIVADVGLNALADWNGGLFHRDDVTLYVDEGRSFVRRTEQRYDLLQISLIDTWAASASGVYSLAEGYLYTVEAFRDYLERLTDDGVLAITRWIMVPPRESLRVVTVAMAALEELGVEDPAAHIAVLVLEPHLGCVIVGRNPLTQEKLVALAEVAQARNFKFAFAPGLPGRNAFVDLLTAPDTDAFIENYGYDVRPVRDDRPFFFQFGRWSELDLFEGNWVKAPAVMSGRLVLAAVFLQALFLSLLLLVLPMLRFRGRTNPVGGSTFGVVGYFFAIGVAFMLLEITLMQQLTLFLGHPIHGITLVLAVLLLAAGTGSRFAHRLAPIGKEPGAVFGGIIGLTILYGVALPPLFDATLGLPLAGRVAISTLALTPIGLLLGVPFVTGLARLRQSDGTDRLVGWAWAANGSGSVVGPVLAMLLAIDFGYWTVLMAAALVYGLAFLSFRGRWTVGAETP
jgi:hypothetical protein